MSTGNGWLDPVRAALDAAPEPVAFFLRDDDAGWDDARLEAMLDVIGARGVACDLAVIPRALEPASAEMLAGRARAWEGGLGLHQHGLAHADHEPEGKSTGSSVTAMPASVDDVEDVGLELARRGQGDLRAQRPQLVGLELEAPGPVVARPVAAAAGELDRVHARGEAERRLDGGTGEDERCRTTRRGREARGQGQRAAEMPEPDELVGVEDEARSRGHDAATAPGRAANGEKVTRMSGPASTTVEDGRGDVATSRGPWS